MRHRLLRSCVLVLLVLASVSVTASTPSLSGVIAGREICELRVCGAAIFVAFFGGQINGLQAQGLAVGGIEHDPLPTQAAPISAITGGSWAIVTPGGTLNGTVSGGTLLYIDGVRYGVQLEMLFGEGGSSTLHAILNHGPFPPTLRGIVVE